MIRNPREDVVSRMTPMEKVGIMRERARKLLLDRGLHINNVDNSNNLDDNIPGKSFAEIMKDKANKILVDSGLNL